MPAASVAAAERKLQAAEAKAFKAAMAKKAAMIEEEQQEARSSRKSV